MGNTFRSICGLVLLLMAFYTTRGEKVKTSGCYQCLLHCKSFIPNMLGEGICRSCLEVCKDQTKHLLQFFKNHQCQIKDKVKISLEVESPTSSELQGKIPDIRRFCKRSQDELLTSFTKYLIKYHICTYDLTLAREKASSCHASSAESENEANLSLVEDMLLKNRRTFGNESKQHNLTHLSSVLKFGNREVIARVGEIVDEEDDDGTEAACTTIYQHATPTHVTRHFPRERVKLYVAKSFRQSFPSGRCLQNSSIMTLQPAGRCKQVHNLHSAVFELPLNGERFDSTKKRFHGCMKPRDENARTLLCFDLVRIEGSCRFFA